MISIYYHIYHFDRDDGVVIKISNLLKSAIHESVNQEPRITL